MAIVPLTMSELDRKLLKGLPLSPPGEEDQAKSHIWKELVRNFDNQADDTFLMKAYHLYDAVINGKQSVIDEHAGSDPEEL